MGSAAEFGLLVLITAWCPKLGHLLALGSFGMKAAP